MKSGVVRDDAMMRRYEPHVAAINRLVDELRADASIPYVDARYGGVESKVLFLFETPGPRTHVANDGSGFLSPQNDDPSAKRFLQCLNDVGLDLNRVITWNAYPWNLPNGEEVTARRLNEGLDPLQRLLDLLPRLRVVLTMGGKAENSWNRLRKSSRSHATTYQVINSLHTSNRGITSGSRHTKREGVEKVCRAMREAMEILDRTA